MAKEATPVEPPSGPVFVSEPAVPTVTVAVRDLPDWKPDLNLFGLEMKRREDFGFIPIEYPIEPQMDPLFETQDRSSQRRLPGAFRHPVYNYAGQTSTASPPDTNGDVGPNHYVQAVNQSVSTGPWSHEQDDRRHHEDLHHAVPRVAAPRAAAATATPVVLYDRVGRSLADQRAAQLRRQRLRLRLDHRATRRERGTRTHSRWRAASPDYPKYGVWPQERKRRVLPHGRERRIERRSGTSSPSTGPRCSPGSRRRSRSSPFPGCRTRVSSWSSRRPCRAAPRLPTASPPSSCVRATTRRRAAPNTPSYDFLEMWAARAWTGRRRRTPR